MYGTLGIFSVLIAFALYVCLVPLFIAVGLSITTWFAGRLALPEALGAFGARVAHAFRQASQKP
jgi:hypothetical protein